MLYTLGEFKDDQLQNITGSIGVYGAEVNGSTADGVFAKSNGPSYGADHSQARGPKFTFDASTVARAGTSTHGKQLGVNYIIKY